MQINKFNEKFVKFLKATQINPRKFFFPQNFISHFRHDSFYYTQNLLFSFLKHKNKMYLLSNGQ